MIIPHYGSKDKYIRSANKYDRDAPLVPYELLLPLVKRTNQDHVLSALLKRSRITSNVEDFLIKIFRKTQISNNGKIVFKPKLDRES